MIVYTLAKKPEKESHRLYLPYLLGAFLIPLIGMWLISLPTPISIPMFNERYSSFVIPPMVLLLGSQASLNFSNFKTIIYRYWYKLGLLLLLLVSQYVFRGVTVTQNSDVRMVVNELKKMDGTTIILEPDHAAFQWLYYTDQKKFQQWRSDSMYHHMAQQLIQNQVFILRTKNSLDSLKLAAKTNLFYVHLDNRKTAHTQLIETQLAQRFTIRKPTNPHIPNSANAFRSKTTEFWELIPQ